MVITLFDFNVWVFEGKEESVCVCAWEFELSPGMGFAMKVQVVALILPAIGQMSLYWNIQMLNRNYILRPAIWGKFAIPIMMDDHIKIKVGVTAFVKK